MCALFFYIWQAPHMPILTADIICDYLHSPMGACDWRIG